MSTGFARDYVMSGKICAKDGKITGVRVDVIADHGAFDSTAQPSKFPAGFFHIFAGSYDLEAAHCSVKAVYTNKAPGGVAYRCSFRVTEAIYLVERLVGELALKMDVDPVELRMKSFIQPGAVPLREQDRLDLRLRRVRADDARGDADRRLRRAAPRAGGEARARRADGDRRLLLHRGRRRRAAPAHGHPRARDGRRRRPARARRRARRAQHQRPDPGPGARDDVRPDRRRGARHLAGQDPGPPRRHRSDAVRPRHLRQPLDPGVRARRPRSPPAGRATRRG